MPNNNELSLTTEFIDSDVPGYRVAVNSGVDIEGIFIYRFVDTEFTSGQRPTFFTVDNESIAVGDSLTIDGATYKTVDDQPDGAGGVVFLLERV